MFLLSFEKIFYDAHIVLLLDIKYQNLDSLCKPKANSFAMIHPTLSSPSCQFDQFDHFDFVQPRTNLMLKDTSQKSSSPKGPRKLEWMINLPEALGGMQWMMCQGLLDICQACLKDVGITQIGTLQNLTAFHYYNLLCIRAHMDRIIMKLPYLGQKLVAYVFTLHLKARSQFPWYCLWLSFKSPDDFTITTLSHGVKWPLLDVTHKKTRQRQWNQVNYPSHIWHRVRHISTLGALSDHILTSCHQVGPHFGMEILN